jgi:hypothetical protein
VLASVRSHRRCSQRQHERFVFLIEEETLMEASIIPVLLQRLEKLERSDRRLKLSGLVVLFGLAAVTRQTPGGRPSGAAGHD